MTASDVVAVLDLLIDADIGYWIAGGWGVDALIGSQSRPHRDLDLHVSLSDALAVQGLLLDAGYEVVNDQFPIRVEMARSSGQMVDLHPFHLDADGTARGQMTDGGCWIFDEEALSGAGKIAGRAVRCVSVDEQIHSHLEFEPREVDHADMALLAARFSVSLPPPYG